MPKVYRSDKSEPNQTESFEEMEVNPIDLHFEICDAIAEQEGILYDQEIDPESGVAQNFIYFGEYEGRTYTDPGELVSFVKLKTDASIEMVENLKANNLPLIETQELLYKIALAYEKRQILLLEGPTSVGKTYSIDLFAGYLGQSPYNFYCNGQTDTSELKSKYVPNTKNGKNKNSQEADSIIDEDEGTEPNFVVEYGALPKAMGSIKREDGTVETIGRRPEGSIVHIQEVGLAQPSIINSLLETRGGSGKMAETMQLWEEDGSTVVVGPEAWIVMSTNPPEMGYVDRKILDPALVRGSVYVRLEELSDASIQVATREYIRRNSSQDDFFQISLHLVAMDVIARQLSYFHGKFKSIVEAGEKGRGQKTPATLDDLARISEYICKNQVVSRKTKMVDLAQTIRKGTEIYYFDRLADKDLKEKLRKCLEATLTGSEGKLYDKNDTDRQQGKTLAEFLDYIVANSMGKKEEFEKSTPEPPVQKQPRELKPHMGDAERYQNLKSGKGIKFC